MNTRTLLAGIIIGLISAPFAVSALTVDEIQAQIRELMAKVAALQEQLRSVQQTNSSSSVTVVDPTTPSVLPANHRMCALLNRNLSFGAYGEDVQSLQEYLREQGYFSGEATGYFGPVTRGALQRWQEYNKIANQGAGWGMFGPISRERIKLWCGGTVNTERFAASPASGSAPLTVTFSTWLSGFRVNSISYSIDFGDGTSERAADCYAPADACQSPGQNMHTYQSDGIYTAKLIKTTDPCVGQPACRAAIHQETVATAQIRVGAGSVACTKEYKPVCALKQVQCITTPCNPVQQTYGNRCMAEADDAKVIYEGACRSTTDNPADDPQCKSWYDGCNSCGRTEPGGLAACTLKYCTPESTGKAYCTAYFDNSSTNRPPVISRFSGPTSLGVNEQGTWSISASDPENGRLTYSIIWGDEWTYDNAAKATAPQASIVQDTSFTHSYARPGVYKIQLTVSDSSGKSAQSTATVSVTQSVCTMEYAPVCGRPAGCANTCAPGMACPAICQLYEPQTYSNRCQLNNANATFIHSGVCTDQSRNVF